MPTAASPRLRLASAAFVAFVLGLGVLIYGGPGQRFVRGTVGDVLVVAFLYFLLGAAGFASRAGRVLAIASLALGLELYQLAGAALSRGAVASTALGTTFDPWDLVAYAVGLAFALLAESMLPRSTIS